MYPNEVLERMREIVEKCMGDAAPFCEAACPMHTDVKGYVGLVAEGKPIDAIKLIRKKLNFPACLGRVCAHPCEENCTRGDVAESHAPMSIAELKRYAACFDDESDWDVETAPPSGKSVGIVGAGPAGAQAAIKLRKAGHAVTIYERLSAPGGMLRVGIPAYRLPRDIIDREFSYLKKLGVKISFDTEAGKDISFRALRDANDAVLLAFGAHKSVILPLAGNTLSGVIPAVELLKQASLNGKYEHALPKEIVVIGGGNVAMDASRTLVRLGVEKVRLFCLEKREEMPAHEWEIVEAEEEGVEVNCGWGPVEIHGDDDGKNVCGIAFQKCVSVFDDEGKFSPKFDESAKIRADVEAVCMAVGQSVDSLFVPDEIEKERSGRIKVNPATLETSAPGVFAAGDVAVRPWLAIEAIAEGDKAAVSIERFLRGESLTEGREHEGAYETILDKKMLLDDETLAFVPRVESRFVVASERVKNFDEFNLGFDDEMARKEAERCVKCECKRCMQECLMLGDFCECPKGLFEEILRTGEISPLVPYSCNMCNQCTLECPQEFKLSERFYDMRKELVKAGEGPLKSHGPIMVHQKLSYSKIFNVTVPSADGKTTRVFFPGCSLPSYNPEVVGKTFEYLSRKLTGVGAVLKCCGKPLKALGVMDKFHDRFHEVMREIDSLGADEIIVACQSCYVTFKQYAPEKKVTSLWELLPEIGLPDGTKDIGRDSGLTFAVHDSCVTRDVPEIHDGIRWILNELGYEIEELPHSREHTRCCGFGGMIVPANPALAKRVMQRRADEARSPDMIAYCAACRASMVMGGKNALHILDAIFGGSWKGKELPKSDGALSSWVKRYKSKKELKRVAAKLKSGVQA